MTEHENFIMTFLQAAPEAWFARKEIARKAIRRQEYEENPHWIDAPLSSLVLQGLVQQSDGGQYRLMPEDIFEEEEKAKEKRKGGGRA